MKTATKIQTSFSNSSRDNHFFTLNVDDRQKYRSTDRRRDEVTDISNEQVAFLSRLKVCLNPAENNFIRICYMFLLESRF